MPVHACGNFKYNTLLEIADLELGKPELKTVHRLDRQTSGIVFFAKEQSVSNAFREALIKDEVRKVYYARVIGDFREACKQNINEEEEKSDQEKKFTVSCNLSVYCVSNVEAVWDCAKPDDVPFEHKPRAKHAETLFEFIHYDEASNHSVLKCFPKTGRTH